ncbi:MAG: hypothetical protein E7190_14465 [Erysipelotrichaceae bacterium]|nr:hypothetical protein [Erysipelotrichaceae bacterium]
MQDHAERSFLRPHRQSRSSAHVKDNDSIFSFRLSEEETASLRSLIDSYPTPDGEPFELERTPGSKYRSNMHMNINEDEQS